MTDTAYERHIRNLRIPVGSGYMTMREHQIMTLYANGFVLPEIASQLGISQKTISALVCRAKERCGASTISNLVGIMMSAAPNTRDSNRDTRSEFGLPRVGSEHK